MRVIKLIIKNNSSKNYKSLEILGFSDELPNGVNISCELIESKKLKKTTTKLPYKKIIHQISYVPFVTNIIKTTNNRLIDFISQDAIGRITDLVPQLTIKGKPRPKKYFTITDDDGYKYKDWDYKKQWDSKKWNIADTKERFFMNQCIKFILNLKKEQTFEIELLLN